MEWVKVGETTIQKQRSRWVVRQQGYDPVTGRQERLGHSDIDITLNVYTHVLTDQHREVGRSLDAVFSAGAGQGIESS